MSELFSFENVYYVSSSSLPAMLALLGSDWPAETEPPHKSHPARTKWQLEAAAGVWRAAGKLQGDEKTILSKFLLHRLSFAPFLMQVNGAIASPITNN